MTAFPGAWPGAWRDEFLAALRFLTRLSLGLAEGETAPAQTVTAEATPSLAAASWAFPVVGIVLGLCSGLIYGIAIALNLPVLAAALLAIATTMIATGGLHEDGLADTADGFGGGATREAKLRIMRDSRIGTYGVLALVIGIGLRMAALADIAEPWHVLGALVAAHALARGLLPAALRILPAARSDGLGLEAGRPDANAVLIALVIAVIIALAGMGIRAGMTATVAAALVGAAIAGIAKRQIGGQTGDVLGAIEQGAEIAVLLAAAAWS